MDHYQQILNDFSDVPEEYRAGLRYGLPLSWIGRNPDKPWLREEMERTFADLKQKGFNVLETGGQGSGTDPDRKEMVSDNWRTMFKALLKRATELGIHIQLSGIMNGQPVGYREPDSDGGENYRPKRLYATDPADVSEGIHPGLSLSGESINYKNDPVAVVAVRYEWADGQKQWQEAKLLPLDLFSFAVQEIPEPDRCPLDPNSPRMKIELLGNEMLKDVDMSVVFRGMGGRVADDGTPGSNTSPVGPENPGMGPPGYEERSITTPSTHRIQFTYAGEEMHLDAGNWDLIGYYQLPNPLETYVPGPRPFFMEMEGNRYTIVNCFSKAGAQKVIDTYEKYIFDDEMRDLFRKNGAGIFYDGGDGEPRTDAISWSENLPEQFHRYTGYDLLPYLPVIYSGYTLPGDGAERLATEKLKVLSILYGEFLETMSEWMETYNAGFHMQAAYTTFLETQEAMGHMSYPEVESLNYSDCMGGYLAASSAARLNGCKAVSCEMGATFRNPYDGRLRNLLTEINIALVGGVTQNKLHTSTFRYGERAKWPGANIHYNSLPDFNDTQPFWGEMDLICGAINRGQFAVRRGTARRDLLVYLRRFREPEGNMDNCLYLTSAGYTYDYYNAEMLSGLPDAENGEILPDSAAFHAIVVDEQLLLNGERMPSSAARAILRFAKAGIPVVLVGAVPSKTEGLHDSDAELQAIWREILSLHCTAQVPQREDAAQALLALGAVPNLQPERSCGLTSWCSDENGVRAYFVWNQGRTYSWAFPKAENYQGKLRLKGTGGLRRVNLWTGEAARVPYVREGDYVCFDADLKIHEAAIYLLGGEEFQIPQPKRQYGQPVLLNPWELQIESWTPENSYGTSAETPEGTATKKELLPPVHLDKLIPWKDISGIEQSVSGVGYYRTTIEWDGSCKGAVLDLGENYDTARIYVNGTEVLIDQLSLRAEIGDFLKPGSNELLVRVPSGLCNVLYSLGAFPPEGDYADFGLLGPVRLLPYHVG